MIGQTMLGVRALSFGLALGAHVAVLGVAGHFSSRSSTVSATPIAESPTDEIDIIVPDFEQIVDPPPTTPEPHTHAVPSHTHPYPVAADHDARPHDPTIEHRRAALVPAPASVPIATSQDAKDAQDAHDEHAHDPIAPTPAPQAPPTFKIPMPGGRGDGHDHVHAGDHDHDGDEAPGSARNPLPTSRVTTPSTCVFKAAARYPDAAREQQIEATITLEIVVDSLGAVTQARVLERVGYGLDEAAIAAAKASRFSPARVDGRAVAERRTWAFAFSLR